MFIRYVDEALEAMLRAALPLPAETGDVTFEAPTGNWAAALSRLTVNLFLYEVQRSEQTPRSLTQRLGPDGRPERRLPQPMIALSYLVSAWAGSVRDEHQLLSDVVNRIIGVEIVPPLYQSPALDSSISMAVASDEHNRIREIWGAAGGQLKASFTLRVAVASDAFDWQVSPPAVERIEALAAPVPRRTSV